MEFFSGRGQGLGDRVFETPTPRTRKVALRSAIVMSPAPGNAFAILLNLVRVGLGGTQGNGRQWVSWIHEADFARAVEFLIEREDFDGPVNIAAPHPMPNREFMAALREAWEMPNGLPAPWPRAGDCGVADAHGVGVGAEEPVRGSGKTGRGGVSVRVQELAGGGGRSGAEVEEQGVRE